MVRHSLSWRVLLLSVICTMMVACVMAGGMCGLKKCCKNEVCVDTSDPCAKPWCPYYECKPVVPEKYCNCLCRPGQVCIDTVSEIPPNPLNLLATGFSVAPCGRMGNYGNMT
uniref:Uncharacterized protein n=1 Tax=Timema genevievae TaxID=629358 RepID=A0A7R9JV84_TIMGE|nr:unnamed protein product [Timema genevievae]